MSITKKATELNEKLRQELGEIELRSMEYTLADAIREGAGVTEQAVGWGDGEATACALTGAAIAARARGFV